MSLRKKTQGTVVDKVQRTRPTARHGALDTPRVLEVPRGIFMPVRTRVEKTGTSGRPRRQGLRLQAMVGRRATKILLWTERPGSRCNRVPDPASARK